MSDSDDFTCEYCLEDGQCGCKSSSQYLNGCECELDCCPYYSPVEIEGSDEDDDCSTRRED